MANSHFPTDANDWFQELRLTLESMHFVLNRAPAEFFRVTKAVEVLRQHLEELVEEGQSDHAHQLSLASAQEAGGLAA